MVRRKIEWTGETWNPTYAGLAVVNDGRAKWTGVVREVPEVLDKPLRWRKGRRVFVNSMSDLFHADVSFEYIAAVFAVMAATPRHKYVILTKRPRLAREWFAGVTARANAWRSSEAQAVRHEWRRTMQGLQWAKVVSKALDPGDAWPLPNVAIGVSVSDQRSADDLIPHLLKIPAAVRVVSAEPLLGPIDMRMNILWNGCNHCHGATWTDVLAGTNRCRGYFDPELTIARGERPHAPRVPGCGTWEQTGPRIDQVIIGAESGPGARHCDISHAQNLAKQVLDAGCALFVKQWTVCKSCHGNPGDDWCSCDPVIYRAPPDVLGQVSTATDGRHTGQTGKLRKGCPVFYVPGHGAQSWAQMPEGWEL